MTRDDANVYLAVILEAAAAAGGTPSGPLYAALMGRISLSDYEALLEIAKSTGLLTESGHVLSVTAKGRDVVAKIAALRAPASALAVAS